MTYRYDVPSAHYVFGYAFALFAAAFMGLIVGLLTSSLLGLVMPPFIAGAVIAGLSVGRKREFILIQNDTLTLCFQGRKREMPLASLHRIELETRVESRGPNRRFRLETDEGTIRLPCRLDLAPFLRAIATDLKIPLIER